MSCVNLRGISNPGQSPQAPNTSNQNNQDKIPLGQSRCISICAFARSVISSLTCCSKAAKYSPIDEDRLYEARNFKYKNADTDFFHSQITEMVRMVKIFEACNKPQQSTVKMLTLPSTNYTIPSVVYDLLNFKEEFPVLFCKRRYDEDLDYIQKELCDEAIAKLPVFFVHKSGLISEKLIFLKS